MKKQKEKIKKFMGKLSVKEAECVIWQEEDDVIIIELYKNNEFIVRFNI